MGPLLVKKDTGLKCDNRGLVDAINKGSSRDEMVMHLLRCLWFFTALFNIRVTATHIHRVNNSSADMLSRNQAERFLMTNLQVSRTLTPLPPTLLFIVSPSKSDWTSPVSKTLQRNNCSNTALGIRTLTNYQPFLEQCCWNVWSGNGAMLTHLLPLLCWESA